MTICTEADIVRLENQYGIRLPATYRSFLLGGHPDVEAHLLGTDLDMRCLPKLREWAQSLLRVDGSDFMLAEDHFVFLMHQGYQFMYFPCDGSDDPPVFYYLEGERQPVEKFARFSDWIALCEAEFRE